MYKNYNNNKKNEFEFIGIRNVNICVCPIHTRSIHEVQVICHFYIHFEIMSHAP